MRQDGKASVWMYVLGGCAVLVVLVVAAVVGIGYFGYKSVQEVQEIMTDPVARTDKTLQLLGAETLPAGYNAMFAWTIYGRCSIADGAHHLAVRVILPG